MDAFEWFLAGWTLLALALLWFGVHEARSNDENDVDEAEVYPFDWEAWL